MRITGKSAAEVGRNDCSSPDVFGVSDALTMSPVRVQDSPPLSLVLVSASTNDNQDSRRRKSCEGALLLFELDY